MLLNDKLIKLVTNLKKLDERKIVKNVHVSLPGDKYGHYKDVCALCEHPTGVGVHFADCPIFLVKSVEV